WNFNIFNSITMSKNLLNPEDKKYMFSRIDKLTPGTPPLWGKMNVNQALRHMNDGVKISFGEVKVTAKNNFFTRTFMRWAILAGAPPPKEKAETFPEINMVERGINPADFSAEVRDLKNSIDRLAEGKTIPVNAMLGKFSRENWGRLNYVHMDHHLRQFGV